MGLLNPLSSRTADAVTQSATPAAADETETVTRASREVRRPARRAAAPERPAASPEAGTDAIESTLTAGNSGLGYDASTGTYTYTWKTERNWAGSCRQLLVLLDDGMLHVATFRFAK